MLPYFNAPERQVLGETVEYEPDGRDGSTRSGRWHQEFCCTFPSLDYNKKTQGAWTY